MKIGMFDSGLGGLTILEEFVKKYPNNTYIYYGDTKNLPYGNKSKEELLNLVSSIISFFNQNHVDLIIIACGTISSTCLEEIKKMTNIPVYDIITPTIAYLKKLSITNIAIFATQATINTHVFKAGLQNKNITEIATTELVPMIENNNIDIDIIKKYCNLITTTDVLVLGCTHYPLIKEYLTMYLPNVLILNMAFPLLDSLKLSNNGINKVNLYFSKVDKLLENNIKKNLKFSYSLEEK